MLAWRQGRLELAEVHLRRGMDLVGDERMKKMVAAAWNELRTQMNH